MFSKCSRVLTAEGLKPVAEYGEEVEKQLLAYQNQARRTLGFAYKTINCKGGDCIEKFAESDLIFLGIVAISDPVRPDVPAAVQRCLNAGIDVKIVTGDTPATAREIRRQIGKTARSGSRPARFKIEDYVPGPSYR